ncbi:1-deoxy-D-xylulose-5-phosphate synthase [Fundidesulfovibrio magnetotacticus]|uniref:1-deoxy-D-xylulose-5-phosphate synthase n=1 Tax=Fundidesulfovibrio magnetotacticus TaxID=2730080 RepID=A0A6V8M4Y5_9BACT|nr:1-deoxy-D-xylulose-5-phosphate synthase [Fundidesulfovibrio magnetotacticus]GFK95555.1 1-deoxy-D-xylulose-5-phosphate synthase [Fundidesulfovibrio magnetotacticus]
MSLLDGHPLTMLARVDSPTDVAALSLDDLGLLAQDIRELIIATVSENGGHLAPSLGVVELTLALLKVLDLSQDKIVWDVGHQAYAYKILTGRRDAFHTLRTMGGVSGFPRMAESPFDHFGTGHSSTSISAASGMAMARDVLGESGKVVAVIGDGSMTAGLAYEGLNEAGGDGRDLVVVLNDNKMSISKNVGALSLFLSRQLSNRWVKRAKKEFESMARHVPFGLEMVELARRGEESFKGFFTPGMLFEAFHFNYLGPIDGHDLPKLVSVFKDVREMKGPVLVHVLTQKGKGYTPAEQNPTYYHGVGSFEPETGEIIKNSPSKLPTYTDVFGDTLCKLARTDRRIVAITAAMPEGTGLSCFAQLFPDRFVDVGICEQHAVTFAGGMATRGLKPVVAIYSTFLQRSYDQIVHDVCLQNLPVTFCLDRGGLVGEDGATHHGVFDLSYLRHIPNLVLMAPKDEAELQRMLATAMAHPGPAAIRYLRGVGIGAPLCDAPEPLTVGEGELLRDGKDAVIVAIGSRVLPSLLAAEELERESGLSVAVYNARFVKPLPEADLLDLAGRFGRIVTVEENAVQGGFGSAVLELLADRGALTGQRVLRLGIPDHFVEHGPQKALRELTGISKDGVKRALRGLMEEGTAS